MSRLPSLLWYAALASIVAFGWLLSTDAETKPDLELVANCIAEYDYTHPETPMMDNLIAALKVCKP